MFMFLIALQACLLLYSVPCHNLDVGPDGIVGTTDDVCNDDTNTQLWDFVTNTDKWNSLTFILTLIGIASAIGLIGVVAGSAFAFKTDFLMLAPAVAGLISMGVVFVNLANVIGDELKSRIFTSCLAVGGNCAPVNYILAITIGPIAFYYVWTIIEWWRGKDY